MKKLLVAAVTVAASVASFSAVAQGVDHPVLAVNAAQAHDVFQQGVTAQVTADKINAVVSTVAPTVVKAKVTADAVSALVNVYKNAATAQAKVDAVTKYVNAQKAVYGLQAKRDIKSAEVQKIITACVDHGDAQECANAVNQVTGAAA